MGSLSRFVNSLQRETTVARQAWSPASLLSPWQLKLFNDQSESRIADAGRGAGKTFEFAVELLDLCVKRPGARTAFFAKSETDARELILPDLLQLNDEYALGGVITRNLVKFPNGAFIRITGAKDPQEGQRRFRGRRFDLVVGDECSLIAWLGDMVQQAILPTLIVKKSKHRKVGENGRLLLGGTPGPVPGVGYFEEICKGEHGNWSVHIATCRDNPHVDVEAFLAKRAAELGGPEAPIFRREYLRERVPLDGSSGLMYQYSIQQSPAGVTPVHYENAAGKGAVMEGLPGGRWTYTLGVDLGHSRDASSILVIGVTTAAPGKAWLVEEFLFGKRPLNPALAEQINLRNAKYRPIISVCDEGALGVQTADNLRAPPHNVSIQAADKLHPLASSDALNSALANQVLLIPSKSRLATDLTQLRWDPDQLNKGRRIRAKYPHSDLEPPLRYVWPTVVGILGTVKGAVPKKTMEDLEREEDLRDRKEAAEDTHQNWYRRKRMSKAGRSPIMRNWG